MQRALSAKCFFCFFAVHWCWPEEQSGHSGSLSAAAAVRCSISVFTPAARKGKHPPHFSTGQARLRPLHHAPLVHWGGLQEVSARDVSTEHWGCLCVGPYAGESDRGYVSEFSIYIASFSCLYRLLISLEFNHSSVASFFSGRFILLGNVNG